MLQLGLFRSIRLDGPDFWPHPPILPVPCLPHHPRSADMLDSSRAVTTSPSTGMRSLPRGVRTCLCAPDPLVGAPTSCVAPLTSSSPLYNKQGHRFSGSEVIDPIICFAADSTTAALRLRSAAAERQIVERTLAPKGARSAQQPGVHALLAGWRPHLRAFDLRPDSFTIFLLTSARLGAAPPNTR